MAYQHDFPHSPSIKNTFRAYVAFNLKENISFLEGIDWTRVTRAG
jgi:hypothetical protein